MTGVQRWQRVWLGLGLIVAIALIPVAAWAQGQSQSVEVYFFHSETCPHCREQMPLMQDIDAYHDDIEVHIIEVTEAPAQWQAFLRQHAIPTAAVPRTAVGDITFVGYDPNDGPLQYTEVYAGYIGFRNQILQAIETAVGHEVVLAAAPTTDAPPGWMGWIAALPRLYLLTGWPLRHLLRQAAHRQRYWVGGLVILLSLLTHTQWRRTWPWWIPPLWSPQGGCIPYLLC